MFHFFGAKHSNLSLLDTQRWFFLQNYKIQYFLLRMLQKSLHTRHEEIILDQISLRGSSASFAGPAATFVSDGVFFGGTQDMVQTEDLPMINWWCCAAIVYSWLIHAEYPQTQPRYFQGIKNTKTWMTNYPKKCGAQKSNSFTRQNNNNYTYILKTGFCGFRNPQKTLNFPQKCCLRTRIRELEPSLPFYS